MPVRHQPAKPSNPSYQRVLFSWLHLSDIHFGHGDDTHQSSQQRIVSDLLVDVRQLLANNTLPAPQVLLLTGDSAFKGSSNEYLAAEEWLLKLIFNIGIKRRNVFTIPGNHDVQRTDVSDR